MSVRAPSNCWFTCSAIWLVSAAGSPLGAGELAAAGVGINTVDGVVAGPIDAVGSDAAGLDRSSGLDRPPPGDPESRAEAVAVGTGAVTPGTAGAEFAVGPWTALFDATLVGVGLAVVEVLTTAATAVETGLAEA